jgi:hypothetical protein
MFAYLEGSMWSHKRIKSKGEAAIGFGVNHYSGGWIEMFWEGKKVFTIEEWTLYCCGAASFSVFDNYISPLVLGKPENVQSLFRYLNDVKNHEGSTAGKLWYHHFRPHEYFMLFSTSQAQLFKEFVKNPHVKLIDKWKNKSSGGSGDLYLCRLSEEKDLGKALVWPQQ